MKTNKNQEAVFFIGKKILLRPLSESDINAAYLSWLNDQEVTRFIETGRFPTTKKQLREYYKHASRSKTDAIFAIIERRSQKHIGNIRLGSINWIHRNADLGIMIGDKHSQGKGYGQQACRLLLSYAFHRLNLNKVILGVYSNHLAAINAYKKVGFRIEGRIKKFLHFEDSYVDKVIMGISQKEFAQKYSE